MFGLIMTLSVVRFWWKGWIESFYVAPGFHFTYLGFAWVEPPPAPWVYLVFVVMGLAALCLALGLYARVAALIFFLSFTWMELCEKSTYLNHYYLVSLLALLFVVVPSDRAFAVRRPRDTPAYVPLWAHSLVAFQVACVYAFAGLAKLNGDWILRGEPLATWLLGHTQIPIIGPLLGEPAVALAMSWAGCLFDLTVWALILWRPTRWWAYGAAVGFHLAVGFLFPIGMFPWVMIAAATMLLPPDWPRRFIGVNTSRSRPHEPMTAIVKVFATVWVALQLTLPLRSFLYPGPTNWTEEGFRFAWRVMLVEKTGMVEYRVETAERSFVVFPSRELATFQSRMLQTEPDLILEYAHHIRERFADEAPVQVYADAFVSWNGRPAARLIDPSVDLAQVPRTLKPATWILRDTQATSGVLSEEGSER